MSYSIYIYANAVLVLSKALSPACTKDVLDTIAFASLAADEDVPGRVPDSKWFECYSDILSACGWTVLAQQERDEFPRLELGMVSGQKALVALVESAMPDREARPILAALDHVATSSAWERQLLYPSPQNGAEPTRVRAAAGIVEEGGFLSMVSVSFQVHHAVEQAGLDSVAAAQKLDGGMVSRVYSARFNQQNYDEFRDETVEWLAAELHTPYTETGVLPMDWNSSEPGV
ncbi:hypothetical protein [Pseudomonas vancouverensis]|uniref:Uncharacterized protein n=1 Tax=Pseudomonas vancouverensis TaxID=95300 RepID=A0A1H2PBE6_PSEVA|nr:hypothetical protein [Pseudomonas vancouverensis]KAB0491835.1 hypothetical protein F7R09_24835 [Pseudomonas vancouverensis]TDB61956.1 hypothetical protein EIY72_14570 [Pseudomonas vancouverensis]SDV14645.1 hypothetical protein SAMN05216558_4545 [Pseudomonas vancouverensis]